MMTLEGRVLLLIGNGPSSWWIGATELDALRKDSMALTVAACNRTAALLPVDVAGAVDRDSARELIRLGVYHRARLVLYGPTFKAMLKDDVALPHSFSPRLDVDLYEEDLGPNPSTGVMLARALAKLKPSVVLLIGFDGSDDARTRWNDRRGAEHSAAVAKLLDCWRADVLEAFDFVTKERAPMEASRQREVVDAWIRKHARAAPCPS